MDAIANTFFCICDKFGMVQMDMALHLAYVKRIHHFTVIAAINDSDSDQYKFRKGWVKIELIKDNGAGHPTNTIMNFTIDANNTDSLSVVAGALKVAIEAAVVLN